MNRDAVIGETHTPMRVQTTLWCYWGNPYADESSDNSLDPAAIFVAAAYSANVAAAATIAAVSNPSIAGLDVVAVIESVA